MKSAEGMLDKFVEYRFKFKKEGVFRCGNYPSTWFARA